MHCAIKAPSNVNNVVNGLNVTELFYLEDQIELIGKLASSDTSKSECFPVHQNMFPFYLNNHVYTFSIITTR